MKGSKLQSDDLERVSQQQLPLSVLPTSPWLDCIQFILKKVTLSGVWDLLGQISFAFSVFLDVIQGAVGK